MEIRTATTDAELEDFLSVRNAVYARDPLGLHELRSWQSQVKEMMLYVARDGGRPVGAGFTGLLFQKPDVFAHAWVLKEERRRGLGTGLYQTISDYAASHGKDALEVWVEDYDPDGAAFVEKRGFAEIGRELRVSLDLAGIDPPEVRPPAGVTIMTWADRPELIHGIYDVAVEASADIPGDEEDEIEPFEDWVAHEMQAGPGDRPEATFVAVAGDEVVGYSKFSIAHGNTDRRPPRPNRRQARVAQTRGRARAQAGPDRLGEARGVRAPGDAKRRTECPDPQAERGVRLRAVGHPDALPRPAEELTAVLLQLASGT